MIEAATEPRRGVARLLPKQMELVADTKSKILIYRGGYRSGKTTGLCAKAIDLGARHWPHPVLAIEPSFPMIRSVFVATMQRLCSTWGLPTRWQEWRKTLTIGKRKPITILCRSADAPRSLEGLTVGSLIGDEWELWDTEALKVAMARVSIGPLQQIVLGGTPEGFGPGWELLEKHPKPTTRVIVSKTTENTFVRTDYSEDMRSRLSEEEAKEKLDGERSAPGGRVLSRFDPAIHLAAPCVPESVGRLEVWAGFSFLMHWLFVLVDDRTRAFHVVGEMTSKATDSELLAQQAQAWIAAWEQRRGRHVTVADVKLRGVPAICDAMGIQRSASTPLSHIAILLAQGFKPKYPKINPSEEDRIASLQKVLADVRLTVDAAKAPQLVQALQQARRGKSGHVQKEGGLEIGLSVVGNGVMWHSPAYRPANAYMEMRSAEQWEAHKSQPLALDPANADPLPTPERMRALPDALRQRFLLTTRRTGITLAGSPVTELGCTIEQFCRYIASKWQAGMSWENYGRLGWHLDHIRPLASFDLSKAEEFKAAAHYSNYQPLWARDNQRKHSSWKPGA